MKSLAIDSASSCISIAARNEEKTVLLSLDIGMRQSEKILPAIVKVLDEAELLPQDLDFSCLCLGPGSFTGLRLSFAALKAMQLSHIIPIYGIPTLAALAHPYKAWPGAVVPCIDAKKHRFYTAVYRNGVECTAPCDIECKELVTFLDSEEKVLCTGPDAKMCMEEIKSLKPDYDCSVIDVHSSNTALSLLDIAYEMHCRGDKPLEEYEGPVYIRPSEAEESLLSKHS